MKILTQLTAVVAEADMREPRGILSAAHDEPAPGWHRLLQLGGAGVYVRRRDTVVCIPRAEIFRLAELAEPALAPPAPAEAEKLSPVQRAAKSLAAAPN